MLKLVFEVNKNHITANIIDDLTNYIVRSFTMSNSKYLTFKNYINRDDITFGSIFVLGNSIYSYCLCFFNNFENVRIAIQNIEKNYIESEYTIEYKNIVFIR